MNVVEKMKLTGWRNIVTNNNCNKKDTANKTASKNHDKKKCSVNKNEII